MTRTENNALGGLPLTLADVCDFRTHGPRMRLDDHLTPSRRFAARVSASTATVDSSPGRGGGSRAADYDFASVFPVPTVASEDSAEAPVATTSVAQPTPSRNSVQGTDSVEPTGPTAPVSTSPGSPAPQMMTPFSDRISTRTCRRSATAAGMAPPAVDYCFRPGGPPRPSSRRVTIPPRARRPRPAPPAAATPTLADPPARTIPLSSDYDHAEPMGTPLLQLTPSPGDTPAAPTRSDALDDAAELRFVDSVARYSHADWKREQHAEPTCHITIHYISIRRPSAKRPSLSDIRELAGKGRLHTTDDDIVLLVRNPALSPTRSEKPNSVGRAACLRRASSNLRFPAHAPLDHASLSLDGLLSPSHHAHVAHAGAVLLVDWQECVHPVVASPLLEVPSAETPTVDCPLAHHHNASTGRSRCRRQY